MAVYNVHVSQLRLLGAKVEPAVATSYRGVQLERGAAVVLDPSFAPCLSLLRPKLPTAEQVHTHAHAHAHAHAHVLGTHCARARARAPLQCVPGVVVVVVVVVVPARCGAVRCGA